MSRFYKIFFFCIVCMFPFAGQAQLCTGSPGVPVTFIDFGQGNNPGSSLTANKTSLSYTTEQCFDDGLYSLRNSEYNCHFNTWHSLSGDHTGNADGYFMLINAAAQGSVFYTDTIRNLCGNTNYELAGWFLNLNVSSTCNGNPIRPNIGFAVFTVGGTLLQSSFSGEIPVTANPEWKQYGTFFTIPAGGGDIVFKIFNNAPGGCGNDLAMDDISFRACGPLLTASVNGLSESVSFCESVPGTFDLSCNITGTVSNPSWQWQVSTDSIHYADIAGATNLHYLKNFASNATPGKYFYRISLLQAGQTSASCRVFSSPVKFTINPLPVYTIHSNSPVCENTNLVLSVTGDSLAEWTDPAGISHPENPLILPGMNHSMEGKYYATIRAAAGCERIDSVTVKMNPAPAANVLFSDTTVCSGNTITLHASGGAVYSWSPVSLLDNANSPDPQAATSDSALLTVIVQNGLLCADTAFVKINTIKKPLVDAGPDKTLITGTPVKLTGNVSGDIDHFGWVGSAFLDDPFALNPFVSPPSDMNFILTAFAIRGCGSNSDTVYVHLFNDLYIPNIFTPNGDGRNDVWRPPSLDAFTDLSIVIFDRAGIKVFETNTAQKGWDGKRNGKDLPEGSYVYFIRIKDRKPVHGNLILAR